MALQVDGARRVGGVRGNDFGDGNLSGVRVFVADDAACPDAGMEVEDGFDFFRETPSFRRR